MEKFDTSNFPTDHPCYCSDRKKVPGTFTDETGGKIIREMVALRAKSYAYDLAGVENIKAKGVRGHVVKNHMTLDNLKQCLFWKGQLPETSKARELAIQQTRDFEANGFTDSSNEYTNYRVNKYLRSMKHNVKTIEVPFLALNRDDDKRYVMMDQIHTLSHGHYLIE